MLVCSIISKIIFLLEDNSGFIEQNELPPFLQMVYELLIDRNIVTPLDILVVSEKDIQQFLINVDYNHDGKIGLQEFQKWYIQNMYAHVLRMMEDNILHMRAVVDQQPTILWNCDDDDDCHSKRKTIESTKRQKRCIVS